MKKNQMKVNVLLMGLISVLLTCCTTVFTTSRKHGGTQSVTISTENKVSVDSANIKFR